MFSNITIDLSPDGPEYAGWSVEDLLVEGVDPSLIGAAMKVAAIGQIKNEADGYRAKVASTSAGKLAAYKIKEEIARDPDNASPNEIALIEREATARGLSFDQMISVISQQATAYREIALLIEVVEAEASAAISNIADDSPEIADEIEMTLSFAKEQADAAFAAILS